MSVFQSSFGEGSAPLTLPGVVPLAPTPPLTPSGALPATAPNLNLGLGTVTIIVAGNVRVFTAFANAVIQRR